MNERISAAAGEYVAYEEACEAAGVGVNCPHGFRWTRCLDGCQVTEHGGRLHFEEKTAPKRFVCRGHTGGGR